MVNEIFEIEDANEIIAALVIPNVKSSNYSISRNSSAFCVSFLSVILQQQGAPATPVVS